MTDPLPTEQAGSTGQRPEPVSPDPATTIVAEGVAAPATPSLLSPGQLVSSRFHIVRLLGRGGMGEVYEAEDLELRTRIALKTVRPEIARDPRALARFKREIQLARQVTHPNVCRVFDFRQDSPWPPYLTMELLRGETLAERLERTGPLAPGEALPLVQQMAAALEAAHRAGVIHRDFKTGNVILLEAGPGWPPRAVVTDFGVALEAGVGGLAHAGDERGAGTPGYMAPEQIRGEEITPAADLYALGLVLHEMLTGTLPFTMETPGTARAYRLEEAAPALRATLPSLDTRWEAAILRCLEPDPADRFESAERVLDALAGRDALRPPQRLAVPPFSSRSARPDLDWLSTALAEIVARDLGAGEGLRPLPGGEVAEAAGAGAASNAGGARPEGGGSLDTASATGRAPGDRLEIRRRLHALLGAERVLWGAFAISDEAAELAVELRLESAESGEVLAEAQAGGPLAEIPQWIAPAVADLRAALSLERAPEAELRQARAGLPRAMDAWRDYATGLARLRAGDDTAARGLLESAVRRDPSFPLAHASLSEVLLRLGHESQARRAAQRAFERSAGLSREERLLIEARYREVARDWARAIEIHRALWIFFPERIEPGLDLARAQAGAEDGAAASATVEALRGLPPPLNEDPRIDLADATAAAALSDFPRLLASAEAARSKAEPLGAWWIIARAAGLRAHALRGLGRRAEAQAASREARRLHVRAGNRSGAGEEMLRLGSLLRDRGRLRRAATCFQIAERLFAESGREEGLLAARQSLATLCALQGELDEAARLFEECLEANRRLGNRQGTRVALNNLGGILKLRGDLEGSARCYRRALALARELGNPQSVARLLDNLARLAIDQGNLVRAREHAEEALVLARRIGDRTIVSSALVALSFVLVELDDLRRAVRLLEESLAIRRETGEDAGIPESLAWLAEANVSLGDPAAALRQAEEALAIAEGRGDLAGAAQALHGLGLARLAGDDLSGARAAHERALALRAELEEAENVAHSRRALAEVCLAERRPREAEALLLEALAEYRRADLADNVAWTEALLADAMLESNRADEAERVLDGARGHFARSESRVLRREIALVTARVRVALGAAAEARRPLEAASAEAEVAGHRSQELTARLALGIAELSGSGGDAASGRSRLRALEREARAQGFHLTARRAAEVLAAGGEENDRSAAVAGSAPESAG